MRKFQGFFRGLLLYREIRGSPPPLFFLLPYCLSLAASTHFNISFREAHSCFKQRCMLSLITFCHLLPLIVTFLDVPMALSRSPPGRLTPRLLTWQHALCEIAAVFLTFCWLIQPIFAAPSLLFSNNDMTWLTSSSNRSNCSNKNKNNYVLRNPPQALHNTQNLLHVRVLQSS